MRIQGSVWFEFRVHMTEDEEAEAGLDASFEFLFDKSSQLIWQKMRKERLYLM